MTDCPNAEMRDRLPDLLHERLDASARAAVDAHVRNCADCTAELALLRQMRVSLSSGVVSVDTVVIARAVIARTAAGSAPVARERRWSDWRLAAAVALLAVGASLATMYAWRSPNGVPTVPVRPVANVPTPESVHVEASGPASVPAPAARGLTTARENRGAELAAAGDVSDLSDGALRALLNDLETIEALPATEPEPVTVRVYLPGSGGAE
jgi:anti-sigma factor RsiW